MKPREVRLQKGPRGLGLIRCRIVVYPNDNKLSLDSLNSTGKILFELLELTLFRTVTSHDPKNKNLSFVQERN